MHKQGYSDEAIISIHAAQEGCDKEEAALKDDKKNFNPRSPRGLRQRYEGMDLTDPFISIHAAQEGCDVKRL